MLLVVLTFVREAILFVVVVVLVFLPISTPGQSIKKKAPTKPLRWISVDKSLSVLSPVSLPPSRDYEKLASPSKLEEAKLEEECGYKSIWAFGGGTKAAAYMVHVLELTNCLKKKKKFEEIIRGLQFVLGGDDDHDFEEVFKKVNGLNAKELIYEKQDTRGLMLEGDGTIYVLGVTVEKRSDLYSDAANKFFTGFRFTKIK